MRQRAKNAAYSVVYSTEIVVHATQSLILPLGLTRRRIPFSMLSFASAAVRGYSQRCKGRRPAGFQYVAVQHSARIMPIGSCCVTYCDTEGRIFQYYICSRA